MTELTTEKIIKLIIAVFVLVVVIIGVYLSFKYYIIPRFKFTFLNQTKFILGLIWQ